MSSTESLKSFDSKDLLELLNNSDPDTAFKLAIMIIAMAQNG